MGPLIILLLSVTGLLLGGLYIYGLIDKDRRDDMEKADQEITQLLLIKGKNND